MNSPHLKNEGWLYGLAFLIAIGFRFIQLGVVPLTDSEARLALQAFHLAQGQSPLLAPQAAYILFTSIFFAILEGPGDPVIYGGGAVGPTACARETGCFLLLVAESPGPTLPAAGTSRVHPVLAAGGLLQQRGAVGSQAGLHEGSLQGPFLAGSRRFSSCK